MIVTRSCFYFRRVLVRFEAGSACLGQYCVTVLSSAEERVAKEQPRWNFRIFEEYARLEI